MLYLAIIFHMHQPYYKNLLTQEAELPWVRLHGTKDYLDMVEILEKFPLIHETFNFVPSLLEQVEDYNNNTITDRWLELSRKPAEQLTEEERGFILENFFAINPEKVIAYQPRYYELYLKKQKGLKFNDRDLRDLQAWFNLSWIDPSFRSAIPKLKQIVNKGRFFTEEEKNAVLDEQLKILKDIIPAYRKYIEKGQVEVTVTPYFHPILPLLYNTKIAKEANPRTILPRINFNFPQDAKAQINSAVEFYKSRFAISPAGIWPSEESVSEHILPFLVEAGVNWIVTDEAILFKSLKRKKRDTNLLYQPHQIIIDNKPLNIVFRDRNLSDLIGFTYYRWSAKEAVNDFMHHLENISLAFTDKDILVTIAMDGENAWEYYTNDGHDFLEMLYTRLSEAKFLKATTVSEYLQKHTAINKISRLAAGSWIFADFGKWIGNPVKVKGWEYLAKARAELKDLELPADKKELAWKQIYILEGSDWFWWFGEDPNGDFDRLFRIHLSNFYNFIGKTPPEYLNLPL